MHVLDSSFVFYSFFVKKFQDFLNFIFVLESIMYDFWIWIEELCSVIYLNYLHFKVLNSCLHILYVIISFNILLKVKSTKVILKKKKKISQITINTVIQAKLFDRVCIYIYFRYF